MSTTHFFEDTAVLQGRSLRHVFRSVDTIITTAITPIAIMLLFVYVLGGAIKTGTESYVNYLLPGIMLIATHPRFVLVAAAYSYLASPFIGMAYLRLRQRGGRLPDDTPVPVDDAAPLDTSRSGSGL